MISDARFLFTVCQVGAESALKTELAREWPEFRFAFSRPGFVTFKLPVDLRFAMDFDLRSTFARTYGFSLGKVSGSDAPSLASQTWNLAAKWKPEHLHVWQRDAAPPGERGFEPGITPLAHAIGHIIAAARPSTVTIDDELPINNMAAARQLILDCVLVEPNEWWIGIHEANSVPLRWPGGVPPVDRDAQYISRAYLKMNEALLWSRLPVKPGDVCAEIGSAPGGASQVLLERGLTVLGIDPAEMDEQVLAHPNFVHVQKRAADMRRREFRDVKWLLADSNVAPKHTLDSVEAIVTHRDVHVRGMLLTLKLLDWQLAQHIPEYVERVRSWGYDYVQSRQLAFNRQEICLTASRSRRSKSSRIGRLTV